MFDTVPLMLAQTQAPVQEDAPPSGVAPSTGGDTTTTTQNGAPSGDPNAAPQRQPGLLDGGGFLFVMIAAFLLIMIFSTRSQRAERKKREEMLAAIKKGDRVQTIGGILGTVVEVRDADVLLKVDESSNTRIRFARTGIQTIVQDKE